MMKRRTGMTLVEMVVVLVILSLFILIATNVFQMTFDVYQFNRKIAAQLYAQSNVDNAFSILEKELMYSGSMGSILVALENPAFKESNPLTILGSGKSWSVNSKYALAEKVIISKKYLDEYDTIKNYDDIFKEAEDPTKTYFAIFPAEFPVATVDNPKWSISFNDISTTSQATVISVFEVETVVATLAGGSTSTAVQIEANDTSATPVEAEELMNYVSPLLYESSLESITPLVEFETTKLWHGEMIYNSTITLDASELRLEKYIPTIDASYTILLMDNVDTFEVTKTDQMIIATLTYVIPDIKLDDETVGATQVKVSRRFLYTE